MQSKGRTPGPGKGGKWPRSMWVKDTHAPQAGNWPVHGGGRMKPVLQKMAVTLTICSAACLTTPPPQIYPSLGNVTVHLVMTHLRKTGA